MKPRVTVITPTYNHEKYIGECIDSLLSQTFGDWEQIIVDDGSSDATLAIIQSYKDSRIRVIKQAHRGIEHLKETYNCALRVARGDFIGILEGDDFWLPHKLERQLPLFQNDAVALVWGRALWVHPDGKAITAAPEMDRYESLERRAYLRELLLGNFIPALTVMLRKDSLLNMGGFQQTPYMITVDYATWLRCLLDWEADAVSDVVGCWRRHPVQMSTARQHEILDGTLEFACRFYEQLPSEVKADLDLGPAFIKQHWEASIALSCLHEGRKYLLRNNWSSARHEFRNSIRKGTAQVKLKSMLGMLASYLHCDMEGLAHIMGKEQIDDSEIWSG